MIKNDDEPMLKVNDVARYLNMTKSSIYYKIRNNSLDIKHIKMGRMVRFLKEDLEEWINKKREESLPK